VVGLSKLRKIAGLIPVVRRYHAHVDAAALDFAGYRRHARQPYRVGVLSDVNLALSLFTGLQSLRFGGQKSVPAWTTSRAERLPSTFIDNVIVTIGQHIASAAGQAHADDDYLAVLGNALLAQRHYTLRRPAPAETLRWTRSALLLVHMAVQHFQQHLEQPLSVAALAAISGVGVTHFSNTF
jgi:hypothetical protein